MEKTFCQQYSSQTKYHSFKDIEYAFMSPIDAEVEELANTIWLKYSPVMQKTRSRQRAQGRSTNSILLMINLILVYFRSVS